MIGKYFVGKRVFFGTDCVHDPEAEFRAYAHRAGGCDPFQSFTRPPIARKYQRAWVSALLRGDSVAGYRVLGKKLYHNGHEFQIHGTNWIGMELPEAILQNLWNQTPKALFDAVKQCGFNTLRFPIAPRTLEDVSVPENMSAAAWLNFDLKGVKSLGLLDRMVDECEARGLRYIFDLHYLEGGNIPDLWYTDSYSEDTWLENLSFLADRYDGRPGLIGIDIKNEPNARTATWGTGDLRTDWKMAAERAAEAIVAVNDSCLIIVEGISADINQLWRDRPNIPSSRYLPSDHVYGPSVWADYGEGFKDPSFPENMPAVWDKMGIGTADRAVYLGEYGGLYTGKDKLWADKWVQYLKDRGQTNACQWGFTQYSGPTTGGILKSDSPADVNAEKLAMVSRLKGPLASYSSETSSVVDVPTPSPDPKPDVPVPTPPPKPLPTPEPLPVTTAERFLLIDPPPSAKFSRGDIVRLIPDAGPDFLVLAYVLDTLYPNIPLVHCQGWSSVKGEIAVGAISEMSLKLKTKPV